jgi:hypothetical protein
MMTKIIALLLVIAGLSCPAQNKIGGPSVIGGPSQISNNPIYYTGNNCGVSGGTSSLSSETCTITVAHTGDTLIAFWAANGNAHDYSSSTIACGTGSMPTDRDFTWGSSWRNFMVVVPNATAGSCSFKITVTGSMTYINLSVIDFANANTSTPLDNASCLTSPNCQNFGSSNSWSTNSITTANPNELLVSYAPSGYAPSSLTESNGFTAVSTSGGIVYYKRALRASSYSDSWSAGSSGTWGAMITALMH